MKNGAITTSALNRARRKAYWRLLPLLFVCYIVTYVDRTNVSIAKLTMTADLPGFDNAVVGFAPDFFSGDISCSKSPVRSSWKNGARGKPFSGSW